MSDPAAYYSYLRTIGTKYGDLTKTTNVVSSEWAPLCEAYEDVSNKVPELKVKAKYIKSFTDFFADGNNLELVLKRFTYMSAEKISESSMIITY